MCPTSVVYAFRGRYVNWNRETFFEEVMGSFGKKFKLKLRHQYLLYEVFIVIIH